MGDYTVEVTNLSPRATERDVYQFFAFSGPIEHVEIIRSGDYSSTAYVTFKEPHALDTALLLSGATILDQPVCISRWGHVAEETSNFWSRSPWRYHADSATTSSEPHRFNVTPRDAAGVAMTMLVKGFVLGKDALRKAKAYDESHHVSDQAAAKVAEFSRKIGLTDRINTSMDSARSVDEQYNVSGTTRTVASSAARTAAAAARAAMSSSYFAAGTMMLSDALSKASKAAADFANRETRH